MGIAVLLFVLSLPAGAQDAPRWLTDKEFKYPSHTYIAAVGRGTTEEAAKNRAVAEISLSFKTSVKVRTEMRQEFNAAVKNDTTDFSKKTYIGEEAVIESDEELLGIRFENSWSDAKRREWAVLAYINKSEAAQMYDSKITMQMASITGLLDDAKNQGEILYTVSLLNRAVRLCDLTEELINSAVVVDSQAGRKYQSYTGVIKELRSLYRAKRRDLSFSVAVNSADSSGRIDRKLRELLEANDYVVSESRGIYEVTARLFIQEEESRSGTSFATPGIVIRVECGGQTLFSYSKTYERSSSRSGMNNARSRALFEVEQDLEDNFIGKFTAMLGR